MKIDKSLPPDLQNLTRLMKTHAERGSKTRCIQGKEDPHDWTIVTTENPVDVARFARCLMGCNVRIGYDGSYADINSGNNRIRVVREGIDIKG